MPDYIPLLAALLIASIFFTATVFLMTKIAFSPWARLFARIRNRLSGIRLAKALGNLASATRRTTEAVKDFGRAVEHARGER